MIYEVKLKVYLLKNWASIKDFEKEIEDFNSANKEVIRAEIEEIKEVENV